MSERLTEFEREGLELIAEWKSSRHSAQEQMDQARVTIEDFDRKIANMEMSVNNYRQARAIQRLDPVLADALRPLSVKDMILTIAERDHTPRFRANDVCKRLVEAGMYSNVGQAADNVYATLKRYKNLFVRIEKGIYQVVAAGTPASAMSAKPKLGLIKEVEAMLAKHPDWTRKLVTEELLKNRWNFGDKNPSFAVSGAFMALSRLKKRRPSQAPLPLRSAS